MSAILLEETDSQIAVQTKLNPRTCAAILLLPLVPLFLNNENSAEREPA